MNVFDALAEDLHKLVGITSNWRRIGVKGTIKAKHPMIMGLILFVG